MALSMVRAEPSSPQVVCFERLDEPRASDELLRCVALPGRGPGLALGPGGAIRWQSQEPGGCLVAISGDDQVVLWRPVGAVAVRLCRAGRELTVPDERVVVMLDQDELIVGAARLRVHLHGRARRIHAPLRVRLGRAAGAAAIAGALMTGAPAFVAALAGCDRTATGEATADSATASVAPATAAAAGADGGVDGSDAGARAAEDAGQGPRDGGLGDAGADGGARPPNAPSKAPLAPKPPNRGPGKVPKPPIDVRDMPPFVD